MADPTTIVVIAGPTGVGKTRSAIELARTYDGELIGADSVQVYRDFDIGSAKPTLDEREGIEHHLIDVVAPTDPIDAARYAGIADEAIADVAARGRLPIVVGGTGLWLRALTRGLVPLPAVDRGLRQRLEREVASLGTEPLHARLLRCDPDAAAAIHAHDAVRIVRALEVFEQTGVPLSAHRRAHALGAPRYRSFFAVIDVDREEHRRALLERTDQMLRAGWLEEVHSLLERYGPGVRPFGSVGYRQLVAHVRLGVAWDETLRAIAKATRTYARRQRTWFAGEPGIDVHTTPHELALGAVHTELEAFLRR